MDRRDHLGDLIARHRLLDEAILHSREPFLSDWNGSHPFVKAFLGPDIYDDAAALAKRPRYLYFDDDSDIIHGVCRVHRQLDGLSLSAEHIMAGPGSSSLLVALSLWLLREGHREVFYVPPLYYTLHYFLRLLGIRLRPVTSRQLFEADITLNLPERSAVLLLCDPVWYAGRRVPRSTIKSIADWQQRTGSLVLVDGSFQYMQWDGTRAEHSALLDPELTFRLISPTKSLAIPSFRFAYLLHPLRVHRDLGFLYGSLVGSATAADVIFARRALDVLASEESNRVLTAFLQAVYVRMIEQELIETRVIPDCGYFIFAVLRSISKCHVVMGQDYFELKGYPDHVRINLMVAHEQYFSASSTLS